MQLHYPSLGPVLSGNIESIPLIPEAPFFILPPGVDCGIFVSIPKELLMPVTDVLCVLETRPEAIKGEPFEPWRG